MVFFVHRPKALSRRRFLQWSSVLEQSAGRLSRSVIIAHERRRVLTLGTQVRITLASLLVIDA